MDVNNVFNVLSMTVLFVVLVLLLINVIIVAPTFEDIEDRFAAPVSSQSKNNERQIDVRSFPFLSRTHSKLSSLFLHEVDAGGRVGLNKTGSKQSRLLLDVEASSESNSTSNELFSTSSTSNNTNITNITNTHDSESQANNSFSFFPSMVPSVAPSTVIGNKDTYRPTYTTECRDSPFYVSPINDQNLTCQSHANTDCLQWRHLGLTKIQLQQLLESCPQTCQFDCEAVKTFVAFDDLSVNIQIKNVDGFMDGTIKKHFEEVSQRYLQEYFLERTTFMNFDVDALFELDHVELISQAFVDASNVVFDESNQLRQHDTESPGNEGESPHHRYRAAHYHDHTTLRRRQLQSLSAGQQAGTSDTVRNGGLLDVVLRLDGFTMGLSSQQIHEVILLKMKDDKYLKTLKQYNEYFAAAEILTGGESSVSPIDDSNNSSRDPSNSESSRATRIVSYLVPLSIVAFFFGSAIYYHRSIGPKDSQMETQIGGEAVLDGVDSDGQHLFAPSEKTASPKDEPVRIDSETKVDHTSMNILGNGLTNLNRQSGEDTSSTDRDDENTALDSGSFFRNEGRENMPMIVYNIDEDTGRIHDASERLGAKATTKSTFRDTVLLRSTYHARVNSDTSHSSTKGFAATSQKENARNHHSSSSLSTESRLDVPGQCNDEDSTVVSQNSVPLAISSFDYGGTGNSTRIDFDRKDLSGLSQRVHVRAGSSVSLPDRRSLSAGKFTRKSSDNHCSITNTISLHSQTVDAVNRSHRPPMGPPHPKSIHPHQVYRTRSPAPTKDRTHKRSVALLSLSPITKAMKESTDSVKKTWISRVGSEESGHSRNPSLSSATSECDNIRLHSDIEGQRYEIEAPRRGQLGIIVKGSLRNGTTVHAVKDYSPLFGEIHVGDRIVEIEGVDTTHISLIQILKLLKAKKSSSFMKAGGSGHGGNMHIVVSRQSNNKMARQDADTYPSEISHNRDSSNGSDISISKIRNHDDDVTDPGGEYNGYVLL